MFIYVIFLYTNRLEKPVMDNNQDDWNMLVLVDLNLSRGFPNRSSTRNTVLNR